MIMPFGPTQEPIGTKLVPIDKPLKNTQTEKGLQTDTKVHTDKFYHQKEKETQWRKAILLLLIQVIKYRK